VCVGFLHAIASCAFFLLPTKTLSSPCLSTAPCCVSSCVLLCFFCQFHSISLLLCFLLHPICFASLLLLGLSPGLLLLSHLLLLLCTHSAIPRIFLCFFFSPPLAAPESVCPETSRFSWCGGASGSYLPWRIGGPSPRSALKYCSSRLVPPTKKVLENLPLCFCFWKRFITSEPGLQLERERERALTMDGCC